MGTTRLLFAGLVVAWTVRAHDVISTKLTWTQEVSRILLRRCVACHQEGGPAPMPLTSYTLARPWAKAIKEETLERRMPPWGAVDGFGEFYGDMSLTAEEIHVLADWVEGGAPEGEPQYLPAALAHPPSPLPRPRASGRNLRLGNGETLRAPLHLTAIQADAPVRAVAELPGGRTVPLIWIRQVGRTHPPAYVFRVPIVLPRLTKIRLSGAAATVRVWKRPHK
ncbi:MAG: cytochrome c [Bryobacterales bacterium]|nr:cytochrome c [Bryobacterales bacterium]